MNRIGVDPPHVDKDMVFAQQRFIDTQKSARPTNDVGDKEPGENETI